MSRKITKIEATAAVPTRKRVAAYARISCGKDDMLRSLAAQVSYYSELIQSWPDWESAGVFTDEVETGTKGARPEFQRLIAECQSGQVDMVITKSISRFARNTVTLLETVRDLKERGVDVYFEEQNIHTESADGELMLTILASYAQEESRSVSENCKWCIRNNFKEGKPSNNVRIYGYDYKKGHLTTIPEEAAVVNRIYQNFLDVKSRLTTERKLETDGVTSVNGYTMRDSHLKTVLTNITYTGNLLLQKEYISDSITKERKKNRGELPQYFVRTPTKPSSAQRRSATFRTRWRGARKWVRSPTRTSRPRFLRARFKCANCGASFHRRTENKKYKVWKCNGKETKGKAFCDMKLIPEPALKAICAEVLGLAEYGPEKFKAKIAAITVPDDGVLAFTFRDGTERTRTWENRYRCESWTDEMKHAAREQASKGGG
jgi:DNA invertase Pin-like site-specific DNA recombinase